MRTAERMRLEAAREERQAHSYREAADYWTKKVGKTVSGEESEAVQHLRRKEQQHAAVAAELRRSADWHDAQDTP
jgi:hypothetical protein